LRSSEEKFVFPNSLRVSTSMRRDPTVSMDFLNGVFRTYLHLSSSVERSGF